MATRKKATKSATPAPGRHVALLRGVNVGKGKRVAMADLRAVVEDLGFTDVATLLNSGNLLFRAPRVKPAGAAKRLAEAFAAELGLQTRVTVLTADELAALVADNPLVERADNLSRLLAAVPASVADLKRLVPLAKRAWRPEAVALGPRAAYLWIPDGVLQSPLNEAVAKVLGDAVTARNWNTILKLHALAGGARS